MALTKTEWDKMPEKAQWDIKVALRGPDVYRSDIIKWFTTSVIRGRVRKVMRVGGAVNDDLKCVVLPNGRRTKERETENAWNYGHFVEHVQAAASWLNVPIIYIPADTWMQAMRTGSVREAGNAILAVVEKDSPVTAEAIEELKRHLKSGAVHY